MSIQDLIADSKRSTPTIWLSKEGTHELALIKFSTEQLPTAGAKMIAKFEVVTSDAYPEGAVLSYSWDVYNSKPQFRDKAIQQVKTFLCELLGIEDVGASEVQAVEDGKSKGVKVRAVGVVKPSKPRRDGTGMTKPFTEIYFTTSSDEKTEEASQPKGGLLATLKK
jgi:hypothetical protein